MPRPPRREFTRHWIDLIPTLRQKVHVLAPSMQIKHQMASSPARRRIRGGKPALNSFPCPKDGNAPVLLPDEIFN